MRSFTKRSKITLSLASLAIMVPGSLAAQQQMEAAQTDAAAQNGEVLTTVYGEIPTNLSDMAEGPKVEGLITARGSNRLQIKTADGSQSVVHLSDATDIESHTGLFGLNRTALAKDALLNGLPVEIKTVQWDDGLIAKRIKFKNTDLKTASMIRSGTEQRFNEQGAAIDQNAAATEALRGRMGDIDKYNIKGSTNVYFDTGRSNLSAEARNNLCQAASDANAMDNALLLVVGYTDSTGSQEANQALSEKRAGRVVNYLQQKCGWEPWRMLSPTGMAESDPMASNDTPEGKAQNRRVSVNILVSKAVEGS